MAKKADDKEQEDVVVVVEAPQAEIAYRYLPDKNTNGGFYPGVPLRDLHTDEVAQYPQWIQDNLAGSPMYKSVAPKGDGKKE